MSSICALTCQFGLTDMGSMCGAREQGVSHLWDGQDGQDGKVMRFPCLDDDLGGAVVELRQL
jgi:hypothetical protein